MASETDAHGLGAKNKKRTRVKPHSVIRRQEKDEGETEREQQAIREENDRRRASRRDR